MNRRSLLNIAVLLLVACTADAAEELEFNTDVLDIKDRENMDLSVFSRANYIMPGTYGLMLHVNQHQLTDNDIAFLPPEDDPKGSVPCLPADVVTKLGLKTSTARQVTWWNEGQCLNTDSIPGMTVRTDLGSSGLYVVIPQAELEYTASNWDPPSRWDEGIPGVLLDYNLNALSTRRAHGEGNSTNLSGNGTLGMNLGAWRLRADWQAQAQRTTGQQRQQRFDWSRFYAMRALPAWRSTLIVGEDYLDSNMFGSFRYTGASLASNDSMLPPNLRGYAPEISGVARTNARVVIRQQGRVLYDTQVPPGPFRIQDLNDAVSGKLDVRVEEQDGSIQQFQVDTANIPYLTRPGSVRFQFAAGKPSGWNHRMNGPAFGSGEFSWGVSNGWSLYGGALGAKDYAAMAVGVGRDLMAFGALSVDVTQSRAVLAGRQILSGKSYRASYSKRFEEYDSQVTFAGYRFSQRDFMNMNEFLDVRQSGRPANQSKAMYTATVSKQFRNANTSLYANYNHQTYWNSGSSDRYSLSASRYFDLGSLKNLSLSVTGYQTQANGSTDRGAYLSLSIPLGNSASISYSASLDRSNNTHNVSYYDRLDDRNNYMISAGAGNSGGSASGYLTHEGSMSRVVASVSHESGSYSSGSLSMQGGMTLTAQGAALHRTASNGGTRLMIDTDGVSGVPVRGNGGITKSNALGTAVITDINSYYRNQASIDLDSLADNIEATQSVVQATLTEGAIGYRTLDLISGDKAMVTIRLVDGSSPPFGVTVRNRRKQATGIVSDDGSVYLSGMKSGEVMTLKWGSHPPCTFVIPELAEGAEPRTEFLCRPTP
ncbi:outer membrane usher protein [Achromobacter pestifer]|uniref:Outer membrane usher protein PapC n=1 Tax=Achromobacter pestifer TaxID=1353889 RepID=A0A6S6ZD71_9BURK|nr:outer membrane usher protein [Achromobacter pestifer]CAB3640016.1 Outer membrane usher protein PapC [Achromobacter pestifer]